MSTPLRERPDAPLGTLIFRAGLLPAEVIENALEEGVRTGRRLGEILVERGLIKEEDLTRLLAGQKGLPFVPLAERTIDADAARLLDEERAKLFCALPIGFEDGAPVVAVADPTNEVLTRNVSEAIGRDPRFVVAARTDLLEAISRAYSPGPAAPEPAPAVPEPTPPPSTEPEPVPSSSPVAEPEATAPVEPGYEPAPTPAVPALYDSNGHIPDVTIEAAPPPEPPPAAPAPEPEAAAPAPPAAPAAPVVPEAAPAPPPAAPAPPPAEAPAPEPARVTPPSLRVPAPEPDEEPEPAPEPEPQTAVPTARVSIRLTTGERVPVADFPTLDGAKEHARVLIRDLGESGDEWPLVNGRFLRPETIVSVDVESI
jgi:Type II secretion system (T2SS), protein E, N-terminal domain